MSDSEDERRRRRYDSDSSSEDDEDLAPQAVTQEVEGGKSKWEIDSQEDVESDSSESSAQVRVVLSKKQKQKRELQELCEKFSDEMDFDNWSRAKSIFYDILKLVPKIQCSKNPYFKLLKSLRENIVDPEAGDTIDAQLIAYRDMLTKEIENPDGSMSKVPDKENQQAFREMQPKFKAEFVTYATQISGDLPSDDYDSDDDGRESSGSSSSGSDSEGGDGRKDNKDDKLDWSPIGIVNMLRNLNLEKKKKVPRILEIIRNAQTQGFTSLVCIAHAYLCTRTIDESSSTGAHIPPDKWNRAFEAISKCLSMIIENERSFGFSDGDSLDTLIVTADGKSVPAPSGDGQTETPVSDQRFVERRIVTPTSIVNIATRLHVEKIRAMQFTDSHTELYLKLMHGENKFLMFLQTLMSLYQRRGQKKPAGRTAFMMLEIVSARKRSVHRQLSEGTNIDTDLDKLVRELHRIILSSQADDSVEARATLMLIYHVALHDDYYGARDLFLQSKLYESAGAKSDTFGIALNRCVAQLGMCAFKAGLFNECAAGLVDLTKLSAKERAEVLGQGLKRQNYLDFDKEKEIESRERLIPTHNHLSLEDMEEMDKLSSMLISALGEARNPYERSSWSLSWSKFCSHYQSQPILGLPSEPREMIFAAYQALKVADWQTALDVVRPLHVWTTVSPTAWTAFEVRLKEDALRIFLVAFGAQYTNLTVEHLTKKFALPADSVRSVVSKLLLENTVIGLWDDGEMSITINRGAMSRSHHLALQISDQVAGMAGRIASQAILLAGGTLATHTGRGRGRAPKYAWGNAAGGPGPSRGRGRGGF